MTQYENVRSRIRPQEKAFDAYSVWINENIREITVSDENGSHTEYEYTQKQYTKDEYISLVDERNAQLEEKIIDTQLALCDVYEMIGE